MSILNSSSSVTTITANLRVSSQQVEELIEEHIRRKLGRPRDTKIDVELNSYGAASITITHQYGSTLQTIQSDLPEDWLQRLDSAFPS